MLGCDIMSLKEKSIKKKVRKQKKAKTVLKVKPTVDDKDKVSRKTKK